MSRPTDGNESRQPGSPTFTRRHLLGGLGSAGLGLTMGNVVSTASPASATEPDADAMVPFYGQRQAGIITPAQDRLAFATFNVLGETSRETLKDLLAEWTEAANRMTLGQLVGDSSDLSNPPLDTGEAVGSPVGSLTITLGYGPTLFDQRFGISAKQPALLQVLPPLPNEALDPNYSGGDLSIQACSDDPLVAFHAVRNLARLGMGVVEHNWMELGFGRTSTVTDNQATPRNLLGFKDGTRNLKSSQTELLNGYVWVGKESDQSWLRGGSYQVARRIRMFLENWDRDYLGDQQNVIGRYKESGAPLSGGSEFSTPEFMVKNDEGNPVIPADAHVRLASHEGNNGLRILRRGYSYTDGIDPMAGTLLGGLFFIAYMKSPQQFIALQQKLGDSDALNEYIQHIGSALFACPTGLQKGQHWGDDIFA